MKLPFFNSWNTLTKWSGHVLQYQTTKKGSNFITHIRDAKTETIIVSGLGKDKTSSAERAVTNLRKIGIDGVENAIQTGRTQVADHSPEEKSSIDWIDGALHRHRAQKRIVGEQLILPVDNP